MIKTGLLLAVLLVALTIGAGCGRSSSTPTSTTTYSISGTVSGLAGTVVFQDNGTNDLSISSNGVFTFASQISDGASYNVTVNTQPTGQTCTVTNGTGAVSGNNVTNVSVTCLTLFVDEIHIATVPGSFLLAQPNIDGSSIQVWVSDPATENLVKLSANNNYQITLLSGNTQVTILNIPGPVVIQSPPFLYEFHISYSYVVI